MCFEINSIMVCEKYPKRTCLRTSKQKFNNNSFILFSSCYGFINLSSFEVEIQKCWSANVLFWVLCTLLLYDLAYILAGKVQKVQSKQNLEK